MLLLEGGLGSLNLRFRARKVTRAFLREEKKQGERQKMQPGNIVCLTSLPGTLSRDRTLASETVSPFDLD